MKVLIILVVLFSVEIHAQSIATEAQTPLASYQAGIHYNVITPAWKHESTEPVVYEFFSYMCPGCNAFEPIMDQLETQLSAPHSIIRIPVALYPQWEPHAKTYYALEMMGELGRVHKPFFAAIHQHKKQFRQVEDIADWLAASFGIDKQQFIANAKSFQVDSKMRKAQQMIAAMGINRIPTLVINGENKLNFEKLQNPQNIVAATQYLVGENK